MNMKSTGGFTLVELIVVIAILAILAGVAVPAYSGYLNSAEKAGDITALSAVKTAAVAAMATEGEVTKILVELDANNKVKTVTVTVGTEDLVLLGTGAEDTDFDTYLGAVPTMGYFEGAVVWEKGENDDQWTETTITPPGSSENQTT